ncbi:MAG: hypothetical protein QGI83_02770 [Candidatus Latescibacteria bacterium]|nr:hypothetical protein [Candidatus Latescibacterota bacterium]
MQVRTIEFQENFGRVTVEGARQQNVLQREPELARLQMAQVAADEQVRVLRRPNATTETEGTIVDPEARRPPGRRLVGPRPDRDSEEEETTRRRRRGETAGTQIDVVA